MCLHKEYSSLTFHTSFSFGSSLQETEFRICDALITESASSITDSASSIYREMKARDAIGACNIRHSRWFHSIVFNDVHFFLLRYFTG